MCEFFPAWKWSLGSGLSGFLGIFLMLFASLGCTRAEAVAETPQAGNPPTSLAETADFLAARKLRYNQNWIPPGQTAAWNMDCSNTSRWLQAYVHGRTLPRTASAQYEYFRQRGEFRKSRADAKRLAQTLRPGDLLFWENTHKPKRKPPVTHVMTYLGRDERGQMLMVGAQSSRGVAIYRFDPATPMGGYRWFLWFRREGRFLGFARPGG